MNHAAGDGPAQRGALADALGGGQIGRDIAAVDWHANPLGDPANWPRSLRSALRLMLGSRFSMWLAWGPQLTFFCNDAYRRDTLGRKYPWALGRPASQVWEEIWADIGPRIERVVSTGTATWDEALLLFLERSGYAEETYHTFSYSPLAGDGGAVEGMLCVVSEDTQRIVAERRMGLLRSLGAALVGARSERAVFAAAGHVLGREHRSLPFTATYLFDAPMAQARLAAQSGIATDHPAVPRTIRLGESSPVWPVDEVAAGASVTVSDLATRFPQLPSGAWPNPPTAARLVPLLAPSDHSTRGFFLTALNRYRPADDDYLAFIDLIAGQLSAAISAARAFDTERRRARALAELDQAKTTFFTNVSHEFRTPLTLLLGPAEDALADDAAALPAVQRERLQIVRRNGQRMLKLVNAVLDFSSVESGAAAADPRPVDLAALTAKIAETFRPAVERAGLDFIIDTPELSRAWNVDPEMWTKIVTNLLSNALKFTFHGSITVTLREVNDEVELAVADTGVGIGADDQAHLFERFHRVAGTQARSYEGAGVGLALVAELVSLHDGSSQVRSQPGVGSTFTLRLPVTVSQASAAAVTVDAVESVSETVAAYLAEAELWLVPTVGDPDEKGDATGEVATGDRPRVLVADDNADMRRYISALLTDFCQVEVATDGGQALEKALVDPPDLVLTDVMMPNLDGFGLLANLRSNPRTQHVPVVMVSARAGEDAAAEGLDAGANDYLVKPFTGRELRARVRANLELDRTKRLVTALRRSQILLDRAQRLAGVGSWERDLRTGAVTGSAELLRQLEMNAQTLSERGILAATEERVHPADAATVRSALGAALEQAQPLSYEARLVRADGTARLYRTVGEVDYDDDGRPLRLRATHQDITEQRRAEHALAQAAAARHAAAREHEIAVELQRSLLPATTFDVEALDVAGFYHSASDGAQVGGDWYDVIDIGAGRSAVVIGDVMGRGVRAAATMGQLRAAVRAYARLDLPPADLVNLLQGTVDDLGGNQIVTCIYGVYDPGDHSLSYANAGHPPPLLHRGSGELERIVELSCPPLGTGRHPVHGHHLTLQPGSTLLFYTDGLVERRDTPIDTGIDALSEQFRCHADADVAAIPGLLAGALLQPPIDDDVAILTARLPDDAGPPAHLAFEVPAVAEATRGVRARLAGLFSIWSLPAAAAADALLAADELVTNAIQHGAAPIDMQLRRTRQHLIIEVRDRGPKPPQRRNPSATDPHGRGLLLVDALGERWGVRHTLDGKSVWCMLSAG